MKLGTTVLKSGATVLMTFCAFVAGAQQANAQRPDSTIVLEAYEVRRPENADFPMGLLRQEFGDLGYIASAPQVKRRLGNQVPLLALEPPAVSASPASTGRPTGRPSGQKTRPSNPRSSASALLKELSNVHERWLAATESFDTLEPALSKAVDDAFAAPALVVTDDSIRNKLQSVLLDLALINGKLAHAKSGSADPEGRQRAADYQRWADESMAEWIRTYGSEEITQKRHGPDADKLYGRVYDERGKLGRGAISVTIDDPNVQLYVNETIRSVRQPITSLFPGRYRALLMGPNDDARLFRLDVFPNKTTRLVVDWSLASSLIVAEWYVAFMFASSTHPDPAVLARKLAKEADQSGVVLIGMEAREKNWRATASSYSVKSGKLLRSGYTVVEPSNNQKRFAALALFIDKGVRGPDVIVTAEDISALSEYTEPEPTMTAAKVPPAAMRHGHGKWYAAAGAVSALALGTFSLYRYYRCGHVDDNYPYVYRRAGLLGYGATGAGIALGALATYWFYQDTKRSTASKVSIMPSHSGAMVQWGKGF